MGPYVYDTTSLPINESIALTPPVESFGPLGDNQNRNVLRADGTIVAPDSAVDLLDCNGPSLELIVLELQKSVQLLMGDSDGTAEADRLWRASVECQLTQQDQLLSNVSSDQLVRQDQLLTQMNSWRGSVEDQLTQQAQLLTFLQSRPTAQDGSTSGQFGITQSELSKLDKHDEELTKMISWRSTTEGTNRNCMEGITELQTRLTSWERYLDALNVGGTRMDKRMTQHDGLFETIQAQILKLQEVPIDSFRLRQIAVEENASLLQGDVHKLHQLHQELVESLKILEDTTDSRYHMNVTHWETIHALCDNLQVQQQQQMDMISGLRESDNMIEAGLKDLNSESQSIDARARDLQSGLQSVDARMTGLGEHVHRVGSDWHSVQGIHELWENLQTQQEQQAHFIHGLQSDLHSLQLRATKETIGFTQMPTPSQSPQSAPERPKSPLLVVRDSLFDSPKKPLGTAPNEYEDIALQRELSKFPQFSVVAVQQQGLSRLPNLR